MTPQEPFCQILYGKTMTVSDVSWKKLNSARVIGTIESNRIDFEEENYAPPVSEPVGYAIASDSVQRFILSKKQKLII